MSTASWRLAVAVSEASGLPVRAVAVLEALADDPALAVIDAPLLRMERRMLPPWLHAPLAERDAVPAARPIPIGKPQAHPHPALPPRRPAAGPPPRAAERPRTRPSPG